MVVYDWIQPQVGLMWTTQYKGGKLGESTHKPPDFQLLLKKIGRSSNTCLGLSCRICSKPCHSLHHSLLPLQHAAVLFITIPALLFFYYAEEQFYESVSITKTGKQNLEQGSHMLFLHHGRQWEGRAEEG